MTIEHVDIGAGEIHEPKGASTAANKTAYLSNGAGSGSWSLPTPSMVWIEQESDFPTQDATTITLEEGQTYWLAAAITTTKRFIFENNTTLTGGSQSNSALLTYTGTGTMFTGTDVAFTMRGVRYSHPNGQGFDITDTTGGVIFCFLDQCFCTAGTSIGDFDNVGALVINRCSFTCNDGLTTLGSSFGIFSVTRAGFVVSATGAKCIDLGTAVFTTVLEIDNNFFVGPASGFGVSGAASSANVPTGKLATIEGCEFITLTPLQTITIDDIRWNMDANAGLEDTLEDGLLSLTGNATATVISAASTPVKVAGTFVVERSSKYSGDTTGRLTRTGERTMVTPIDIVTTIEAASGTNKDIIVYLAINGSVVTNSGKSNRVSASDPKNTTVFWQAAIAETDYVEIWISNETDTTDLIVKDAVLRIN